ncbi:hypothetical protein TNCV_3873431 [Trichonephila clavipes]|nr:hypothetical protein TNCV_3873431 [Trichonephila clavipes]
MLTGKVLMPLLVITFRFSLPSRLFRSPPGKKSGRGISATRTGKVSSKNWRTFVLTSRSTMMQKNYSVFSPAAFKKQQNTISLEGNEETTRSRFGKITISKI